jgi:hypothetical protein
VNALALRQINADFEGCFDPDGDPRRGTLRYSFGTGSLRLYGTLLLRTTRDDSARLRMYCTMLVNCGGRSEAMHRQGSLAPCSSLCGTRSAPRRGMTASLAALAKRVETRPACAPPPQLLPAPGAASFSTFGSEPSHGRLRHLAAALARRPATGAKFASGTQGNDATESSAWLDAQVHV